MNDEELSFYLNELHVYANEELKYHLNELNVYLNQFRSNVYSTYTNYEKAEKYAKVLANVDDVTIHWAKDPKEGLMIYNELLNREIKRNGYYSEYYMCKFHHIIRRENTIMRINRSMVKNLCSLMHTKTLEKCSTMLDISMNEQMENYILNNTRFCIVNMWTDSSWVAAASYSLTTNYLKLRRSDIYTLNCWKNIIKYCAACFLFGNHVVLVNKPKKIIKGVIEFKY